MANYASLSLKQVKVLHKFLEKALGDSIDDLVKREGEVDAFALILLKQRFATRLAKED